MSIVFNGDSILDLAVNTELSRLVLLSGDSGTTFGTLSSYKLIFFQIVVFHDFLHKTVNYASGKGILQKMPVDSNN